MKKILIYQSIEIVKYVMEKGIVVSGKKYLCPECKGTMYKKEC